MPVRLPPVTDIASRILLEGIVDFAGLFPPAALAIPDAVRKYAHYRASGSGWMLGRFVCPAQSIELFSSLAEPFLPRDAGAIPWRLAVTGSGDLDADLARIVAFNERHRVCFDECGAIADSYEVRVETADDIARIDGAAPRELMIYFELPLDRADELMPHVATAGRRAKLRAGGVTVGAFPATDAVIAFLSAAIAQRVPAKATAGLHHPLRGVYRLTYEDDPPTGTMFGYVNLFLAAALLSQGADKAMAARMLEESDSSSLVLDDVRITWRNARGTVALDRALLQHVRENVLLSFGSCSFTEPVDETRALGWI